jgi:hypothetical protein
MAKYKKLSRQEVRDYVEEYGLGYAVLHGISYEQIADADLRQLWHKAGVTRDEIMQELRYGGCF